MQLWGNTFKSPIVVPCCDVLIPLGFEGASWFVFKDNKPNNDDEDENDYLNDRKTKPKKTKMNYCKFNDNEEVDDDSEYIVNDSNKNIQR